ncbi:unnamed protein product [Brassica oleracea]
MRNIKFKEFKQQYRHNGRLKQSDAGCLGHSASDEIRHAIFRASSCFMVMLDFLLQICQMKRLKSLFNAMTYLTLLKVQNFQGLEALQ